MRVRVRLFALLREAPGYHELDPALVLPVSGRVVAGLRAVARLALAALGAAACGPRPLPPGPDVLRLAVRADVRGFFPNPPFANEAYSVHMIPTCA